MTNAEQPTNAAAAAAAATGSPARADAPQPQNAAAEDPKGKGKDVERDDHAMEDAMEEDDDEEEDGEADDDDDDVEEDEDMADEDEYQEIDASAILPQGRRTRGVKIDYTSAEAIKKAGLDNGEPADVDEEEFNDNAAS